MPAALGTRRCVTCNVGRKFPLPYSDSPASQGRGRVLFQRQYFLAGLTVCGLCLKGTIGTAIEPRRGRCHS